MFKRIFQLFVRQALINADIGRTVRDEKKYLLLPYDDFVFLDNTDNDYNWMSKNTKYILQNFYSR